MTKRTLIVTSIGIAFIAAIFIQRSQSAEAIEPREVRKLDQIMLSVRVSCQEIGPRADITWTPIALASSYTISRKAEQDDNAWLVIGENITNLAFVDTTFPILPDVYEYQVHADTLGRRDVSSPVVAVNIPSCGVTDTLSADTPASVPDSSLEATGVTTETINLIRNPSFETAETGGSPQYWHHGGWGINNGKYIYPSVGKDGGKAAKVEMTSRTSGDIKWFFEDVAVAAGKTYTISHAYKSNETTELTARLTGSAGITYQYIKMLPESSNWTTSSVNITIPQNITSMTLFHILYSLGSLEIDSFSMTPEGSVVPISPPSPTPPPAPANLISNPSLETAGKGGNPDGWFRGGWGTNTRSYTYPTVGGDGTKAAKVEITSYTNGDAKWYFEDIPVTGGKGYLFSHLYKANTPTEILARFTTNTGVEYHHLATVPAVASWNRTTTAVTAPTNALSVTLFHLLSSIGTLETDAFTMTEKTTATPEPATQETDKYIMLNALNWDAGGLNMLPVSDASEITYFVLPVSATGELLTTSATTEAAFVKNVHAGGKKATFSIAGGTQIVEDITSAVTLYKTAFINNIATHIALHDYDGVVIDIENTGIAAQTMTDFIKTLRVRMDAIRSNLILGIYTQPYQIDTVWGTIAQAVSSITWLAPMIYDRGPFSATEFTTLTQAWESKVGKEKLLAGIAVNYPSQDGGLSVAQFNQVLDMVTTEGWKGIGIWNNVLYTQPWRDAQKAAWTTIQ